MKVNKKKVLIVGFGILFLLVVFFGVYLVIVYVMLVLIRDVSYIIVYFEGGLLRYYVFFLDEIVYQNGILLKYYFLGIIDVIRGEYRYLMLFGVLGSYKIEMYLNYYVLVNRKLVYLFNRMIEIVLGNFVGLFLVLVKFNMILFGEEFKKIWEGIDLYRVENEVYLIVIVSINGCELFIQKIQLKKDILGMLSFDGVIKDYQKVERNVSIIENSVGFVGMSVKDFIVRKVFFVMVLFFVVLLFGFVYLKREKKFKDEFVLLRKYVVEGKFFEGI